MQQVLKLLCGAVLLLGSLSFSPLAAQEVQSKVGYAIPVCSTRGTIDFKQDGNCVGQRFDYINSWNIVFAIEKLTIRFKHPQVRQYTLSSFVMGYRFDFDFWLGLFTDRKFPLLSSLYITLAPLASNIFSGDLTHEENLETDLYLLKVRERNNTSRIELGWKFHRSWDVFVSYLNSSVGPFALKNSDSIKRQKLKIEAYYIGMHYAFGD